MAGVYFLYSLVLALLLLVSLPWWLIQMLRLGKYRAGLSERLGFVPARLRVPGSQPVAWLHAVSVGEALAVAPMVEQLRGEGWRVVVSTTTHTGQKLARNKFGAENVFYFPIDLPFCIRPYLRLLRPRLVVLAETEFWPMFLHLARRSGARVAVVNARISDRSFPRYQRCRGILERVLAPVDLFLAQSDNDAARLKAIGAAEEKVEVAGNLKFDVAPPLESEAVAAVGMRLRQGGAPVLVVGSTVEGEEDFILQSFRQVLREFPQAVMVLAPRHKERFDEVAELLRQRRMKFFRRSAGATTGEDLRGAVLLLDTLGELAAIYRYADLAFVGGSLVPRGGHNILEPAFFARAILTGPHTENFRDILRCFEEGGAVVRCARANLGITFILLLRENQQRAALGENAQKVLLAQRGATARSVARLLALAGERP